MKPHQLFSHTLFALTFSLVACQSPAPLSTAQRDAHLAAIAVPVADRESAHKQAPLGQIQIQPSGRFKSRLRFQVTYPASLSQQNKFKTKALDCQNFAAYQVSIQGIGLNAPLYPANASTDEQHTIPATGCSLNVEIADVPSGENRVALLTAYDAEGNLIPGSALSAVFTMNDQDQTVYLNYRNNPAGELVKELLPDALEQPALRLLLAQLDAGALQEFMDQLTGASDAAPTVFPLAHPALVNVSNILADLIAQNGNLAALIPSDEDYVNDGGTVNGSLSGLIGGDTVTLRLSDPATGAIVGQSNSSFSFEHVPPGTWELLVDAPADYDISGLPSEVVVTEDGLVNLDPITLDWQQPVITSLGSETVAQGGKLKINGEHFHPNAASNQVGITGVKFISGLGWVGGFWSVPSSDVSVDEDGNLTINVPADIDPDWLNVKVSVVVNGKQATNQPIFDIVPASLSLDADHVALDSFDLSWNEVENADSYNVYIDGGEAISVSGTTLTVNDGDEQEVNPATLYQVEVRAVINGVEVGSAKKDVYTAVTWSSWGQLAETANENVLAVAASVDVPNKVYFGSRPGGSSLGGIWACTLGSVDDCDRATMAVGEPDPGTVQALSINPANPDVIYAGSETGGVYYSLAAGANGTWYDANSGLSGDALNVRALAIDPMEPNHVYIATKNGIWFKDFGTTGDWQSYSTGFDSNHLDLYSLAIYRPNITAQPTLFAGTYKGGVYRKLGAANWATINTGLFANEDSPDGTSYLNNIKVTALAPHPSDSSLLYGGGTGSYTQNLGFFSLTWKVGIWKRSETGGLSSWDQVGRNGSNGFPIPGVTASTGLNSMQILAIAVDPITPTTLFAATQKDGAQNGGIYRSIDSGATWSALGNSFDSAQALAANPLRLYAGTPTGLYRATQ